MPPKKVSTFAFTEESIKTFVESIFSGEVDATEAYLEPLLDDRFMHKDDGVKRNKQEFIQHVKDIRLASKGGIIRVLWLLQDGKRLSARYYCKMETKYWKENNAIVTFIEQSIDISVADNGKIVGFTECSRNLEPNEEMWEPPPH